MCLASGKGGSKRKEEVDMFLESSTCATVGTKYCGRIRFEESIWRDEMSRAGMQVLNA